MVSALHGDRFLRAVTLRNLKTGEERVVEATSLFLCLGGVPNTQWAAAVGIVRDEEGYLVTGPDLGRGETLPAETGSSQPGTLLPRDQHARRVRGRRRAPLLDQTPGLSGG